MRIVLQRVSRATVTMDGIPPRSVARGYVLLFGVTHGDTTADADRLAARIPVLRLFPDATGRMERNLIEVDGEVMAISQFTLFGSLKKATKPSYGDCAHPDLARALYEYFVEALQKLMPHPVV